MKERMKTDLVPITSLVVPIWSRQPEEEPVEYSAFLWFQNLPLSKRTHTAMKIEWERDSKSIPYGRIRRYRKKWRWDERATDREMYLATQSDQMWIERDIARREADYEVGEGLRGIAKDALQTLMDDPDFTLAPQHIPMFLKIASELQKDAIPDKEMKEEEVRELLTALPEARRKTVVRILMERLEL